MPIDLSGYRLESVGRQNGTGFRASRAPVQTAFENQMAMAIGPHAAGASSLISKAYAESAIAIPASGISAMGSIGSNALVAASNVAQTAMNNKSREELAKMAVDDQKWRRGFQTVALAGGLTLAGIQGKQLNDRLSKIKLPSLSLNTELPELYELPALDLRKPNNGVATPATTPATTPAPAPAAAAPAAAGGAPPAPALPPPASRAAPQAAAPGKGETPAEKALREQCKARGLAYPCTP